MTQIGQFLAQRRGVGRQSSTRDAGYAPATRPSRRKAAILARSSVVLRADPTCVLVSPHARHARELGHIACVQKGPIF